MMKMERNAVVNLKEPGCIEGAQIGRVVRRDEERRVWVDYDGNPNGPMVAKLCGAVCDKLSALSDIADIDVLMIFEGGRENRPVIIDAIYDNLDEFLEEACLEPQGKPDIARMDAIVDGRQMTFDAKEQIVLRAGRASITLTKNGKVVIRGAYVLTRSSGVNRILGGSVKIN
jgi:hypothetical protein